MKSVKFSELEVISTSWSALDRSHFRADHLKCNDPDTKRMIAAIFQPSQSQHSVCLLAGGRTGRCSRRRFNSRISLSFSSRSSSSCSLTSMCLWMLVMASERHWACCRECRCMGIFVSEIVCVWEGEGGRERGKERERERGRGREGGRERDNTPLSFVHS